MNKLPTKYRVRRTTIVLPAELDTNLDLFCIAEDRAKGAVVRDAISEYLMKRGIKADVMPEVSISGGKPNVRWGK